MREPLSRDFSSLQPSQDSWLRRVRDNFQQLLSPARIFPSSANGAPLHLLTFRRTATAGGARTLSLLTHAATAAWVMTKDLAPDKAKLTMVLMRMLSLRRGAPIAPIPNTRMKRATP